MLYSRVTHSRGRVWTSRVLWGWILVGWGLFNLVEGIVDHHILGIHHVRSGPDQTVVGSRLPRAGRRARRRRMAAAAQRPDLSTGTRDDVSSTPMSRLPTLPTTGSGIG